MLALGLVSNIKIPTIFAARHANMEDINNKAGRQDSGQTSHLEEKHDSLYPDTSNQGDDIHRSVCRRDSVDKAYEFLRENDSASTDGQHDPRYLRRKIDRNILPILWSLFFFHYLGMLAQEKSRCVSLLTPSLTCDY